MAFPLVPVLLAAAQIIPSLSKYIGAGETTEKVAQGVAEIASTVAGVVSPAEAIKQIEQSPELQQKFQLAITQEYIKWDQIFVDDLKNARDRDIKLAEKGFRNNRANWLVAFVLLLLISLLAVVILMSNLSDWVQSVLLVALGRVWGYLDNIFSFEFGTTKQSKAKDDTIEALAKDK